jgi:Flp pilus assembly pilin Flp
MARPDLLRSWRPWRRDETGQTTAEYALVILGAAAIATLLIAWAKGSGAIGDLFDEVVSKIL